MRLHHVFAVLAVALGASSARADEPAPKPLRILLVAGAPGRDFTFLRTALVREVQNKRAELSTFVQNDAGVNYKITAEKDKVGIQAFEVRVRIGEPVDVNFKLAPGGGDVPGIRGGNSGSQ